MSPDRRSSPRLSVILEWLNSSGQRGMPNERRLQELQSIRTSSEEMSREIDQHLLLQLDQHRQALTEARSAIDELKGLLEKLTAPPQHPATFLGLAEMNQTKLAIVNHGNTRRVVSISEEIEADSLEVGAEVLLGNELNVLLGRTPNQIVQCGETAVFDRFVSDNRMVIKSRDEEIVLMIADALRDVPLRNGDLVRWDRNAWLALEKFERSKESGLFLEDLPSHTFEMIGGLDYQIRLIQETVLLHYLHPELVRKYDLPRTRAILLDGPPGTGKTMLAQALANWMADLFGVEKAHFMNIKPSELNSYYFSESEKNVREAFRTAREIGDSHPEIPVIMFWDEVDSIGGQRGMSHMRVDDRILNALFVELEGLRDRGNILVVAATNRKDILDAGLLRPGRLGDLVIPVQRPDMRAAHDIFSRYLRPDLPYARNGNGDDAAATRHGIISSAVSRIYSPNGESALATVALRDGRQHTVRASDLVSGANIANIVRVAKNVACAREAKSNEAGIRLEDVLSAVADEFESAVGSLTPANCHHSLGGLPSDTDAIRIDRIQRKVNRPHDYLTLRAA